MYFYAFNSLELCFFNNIKQSEQLLYHYSEFLKYKITAYLKKCLNDKMLYKYKIKY
jgi:hypothetical protein